MEPSDNLPDLDRAEDEFARSSLPKVPDIDSVDCSMSIMMSSTLPSELTESPSSLKLSSEFSDGDEWGMEAWDDPLMGSSFAGSISLPLDTFCPAAPLAAGAGRNGMSELFKGGKAPQ